jgi:hypothetical protein
LNAKIPNSKVQMPNQIQSSNIQEEQGRMERWSNGILGWRTNILNFSPIIPSFQYSIVPQLSL